MELGAAAASLPCAADAHGSSGDGAAGRSRSSPRSSSRAAISRSRRHDRAPPVPMSKRSGSGFSTGMAIGRKAASGYSIGVGFPAGLGRAVRKPAPRGCHRAGSRHVLSLPVGDVARRLRRGQSRNRSSSPKVVASGCAPWIAGSSSCGEPRLRALPNQRRGRRSGALPQAAAADTDRGAGSSQRLGDVDAPRLEFTEPRTQ